jgi:Tfp pilus assembly protein PilF
MKTRSTRSIAVALVVSLAPAAFTITAVTVTTVPAHAQDDATTKAARARFQEGVEFYDKGQFENARAAFLQAYALRKHPAVLLNLAQSSLRSNHHLEAARYFQQYLREASNITAAQRSDAERGLNEARTKVGRIAIDAPANTEIFVDDDRIGTTPMSPIDVEPGTHILRGRVRADETVQISVSAGQVVTAKFGASGAVAVAPAPSAPAPAAPSVVTPKDEPPASSSESASTTPEASSASSATESSSHHSLLSPPKNIVPVVLFGTLAVAGFGTAIGMGVAKSNAQSSADTVAAQIRTNLTADEKTHGPICSSRIPADVTKFGKACAALADNNNKVNTDATVANIALAVGAGATAVTVLYWLFASKDDEKSARLPLITPLFGAGLGGLTVTSTF